MNDDRSEFCGFKAPAPPPGLRERMLAAAESAISERRSQTPGGWIWLRPQLGWITAALVLVAAHLLLNVIWPDRAPASQGAMASVSAPDSAELVAQGVPEELAARVESPLAGELLAFELVRELM